MTVFLKLRPKSQNVLTIVISILIGISNCFQGSRPIVIAEKMSFCERSKFYPKKSNFCRKPKITCYNLSLFILIKLIIIY